MSKIMFYFQMHQPYRLSDYRIFDIGQSKEYFDYSMNRDIAKSVSLRSYIPATALLLNLLDKHQNFKLALGITGTLLEQLKEHEPIAYEQIEQLAKHDRVELLAETYYHSLSSLFDSEEFKLQVKMHSDFLENNFGKKPVVFRNTELLHSNKIDETIREMGFKGVIMEGCEGTIGNKSPYHAYESTLGTKLLPKASKFSDDIAFRFSNKDWAHWPLTPEKYHSWLKGVSDFSDCINICFDFETLGEHHGEETGVLKFYEQLIEILSNDNSLTFAHPSELVTNQPIKGIVNTPKVTSWADQERDESAWLGNELQNTAAKSIYEIKNTVLETGNEELIKTWRLLQTSDHFYYMSTKNMQDGSVHKYFSPYESPYDAFMRYMNVLEDFRTKIRSHDISKLPNQKISLQSTD